MLSDAGYPDGLEVDYCIATSGTGPGVASLLKYQWAKIGVTANIVAFDETTFLEMIYPPISYHGLGAGGGVGMGNPILSMILTFKTDGFLNRAVYSNPVVDDLLDQVAASKGWDEQMALIKEASIICLDDAAQIPLYMPPNGHYWWPWVKNHYGEHTLADGSFSELVSYIWLDLDLKAEMGY